MFEPDPGLRATKRRRTFEEILANGIALFREQGVRRTRTDQIARAAAISPATLFNYFPNKGALAEAWVRGELDEIVAASAAEIGDRGLRPALRGACRALSAQANDAPGLRLEAWRSAGRARERGLDAAHPLITGIEQEQVRERIRQDLPAHLLAEQILEALESGLIEGLREGSAPDDLLRALQARLDLILDGARKRNERVALPRARGAASDPA
jgi:AcrR family transcriptional regulator